MKNMVFHNGKSDAGKRSSFSAINVTSIIVHIKANGEIGIENHGKLLVVERDWSFEEFLTFAGRKIDMMNATRAFTVLGKYHLTYLFSLLSLITYTPLTLESP